MDSVWKQGICVLINHIDLVLEHGKTKHFLYLLHHDMIWQTKNFSLAILTFVCCNFIALIQYYECSMFVIILEIMYH